MRRRHASRWARRDRLRLALVLLVCGPLSAWLVGAALAADASNLDPIPAAGSAYQSVSLPVGVGVLGLSPRQGVRQLSRSATAAPSSLPVGPPTHSSADSGSLAPGRTAVVTMAGTDPRLTGRGSGRIGYAETRADNASPSSSQPAMVTPAALDRRPTPTPFDLRPNVGYGAERSPLDLRVYVVVEGDTVSGIARRFGLRQNTIIWANAALQKNPERLSIGQELVIPPIDGVVHAVVGGDTLSGIARKYGVALSDILYCLFNDIDDPDALRIGQTLLVPGGIPPASQPKKFVPATSITRPEGAPVGSGELMWPVSGPITQRYKPGHRALDIGGPIGKAVQAVDAGYVIKAGWDNSGYGNMLLIDHGNSMVTLYAHLDAFRVEVGSAVEQGQIIGTLGKTGRVTGPHLHFEIVVNGIRQDPVDLLP